MFSLYIFWWNTPIVLLHSGIILKLQWVEINNWKKIFLAAFCTSISSSQMPTKYVRDLKTNQLKRNVADLFGLKGLHRKLVYA